MPDVCAPRRASPLPAEERRAAVLTAAVPLLRARGAAVSTRDLAQAAGVAEGTLFRVFPDKRALLRAALAEALDPAPLEDALAGVDRALPFDDRIRRAVELLSDRMDGLMQLLTALHDVCGGSPTQGPPGGLGAEHEERDARVLAAVASVLQPDAAALRVTPLQAASLVRSAVLGDRLPGLAPASRLGLEDMTACLAAALRRGPGGAHRPGPAPLPPRRSPSPGES